MHITQTALRPFFNVGSTLFDPALIQQTAHRTVADGFHHFVPGLAALRITERNQNFPALTAVEQSCIIHVRSKSLSVDLFKNDARLHFGSLAVERTFFHYFCHTQTVTRITPVVKQSQVSG